jgi:predicted ATPase
VAIGPHHQAAPAVVSNVPAPRTALIGRATELAQLRQLVAGGTSQLVTITGVGGTGKTCLALQVGGDLQRRFPDGVWLVELAPLSDPALIPQAVAAVLGAPAASGRPQLDTVVSYLRTRTLLLVLDNCEHLIDGCAQFAERVLAGCPRVRLLLTSREPLLIAGERQVRIPPLATPAPGVCYSLPELARSPACHPSIARMKSW